MDDDAERSVCRFCRFCRYAGVKVFSTLKVMTANLRVIRLAIASQCTYFNRGAVCVSLGAYSTTCAREFRTLLSFATILMDEPCRSETGCDDAADKRSSYIVRQYSLRM